MNRKYTNGRFIEHKSNLKHNTIFIDTTKQYASSLNVLELLKSSNPIGTNTDKEIINAITNHIFKKDSIFRIQRRGRDKIIIKKCDTKDVLIILNSNRQIIRIKHISNPEKLILLKSPANTLLRAQQATTASSIIFIIPLIGFIFSIRAFKKIKIAEQNNPTGATYKLRKTLRWILFLSLITSLVLFIPAVVLFGYYFLLIIGAIISL